MSSDPPRVGIGVFVLDPSKGPSSFILGQRKGSIGAGTWALPGGHLEHGEEFADCAAREVLEETGLVVRDIKFLTAVNTLGLRDAGELDRHYVTIFMSAVVRDQGREPELLEPGKCHGWVWASWEDLKRTGEKQMNGQNVDRVLFEPLLSLLRQRPELEVRS